MPHPVVIKTSSKVPKAVAKKFSLHEIKRMQIDNVQAVLAQLVARRSHNPKVTRSKLVGGTFVSGSIITDEYSPRVHAKLP
jgi:hypothetical protein